MSNYSVLKQDINNNIYENQTQQITGTVLNAILNEMTASLGAGYQFAGVATLGMNPGDPDQRVFYLAGEGIYTNFGGIQVPAGKLGVLKWDNRWTLQTIDGLGGGGANLTGYVSVASTDDLPDEGQPTLGYLCGTNLYLYVGEGGDTKEGKYQDCGSFRGPEGAYIQDIEQTETSHENGGRNTIKMTLSDGRSFNAYVHNGTTSSGLFPTVAALQAAYPNPVVGQYAFVGAGFPADIYVCTTAGTWTDSGEDYDGDNVDLTDYATKAEVNQLEAKVDGFNGLHDGSYVASNNTLVSASGKSYTDYIPVTAGVSYLYDYGAIDMTLNFVFVDDNDTFVDYYSQVANNTSRNLTTPAGATKVRFSCTTGYLPKVYLGDTLVWTAKVDGINGRVENLENALASGGVTYNSLDASLKNKIDAIDDKISKEEIFEEINPNLCDFSNEDITEASEGLTVDLTSDSITLSKSQNANMGLHIAIPLESGKHYNIGALCSGGDADALKLHYYDEDSIGRLVAFNYLDNTYSLDVNVGNWKDIELYVTIKYNVSELIVSDVQIRLADIPIYSIDPEMVREIADENLSESFREFNLIEQIPTSFKGEDIVLFRKGVCVGDSLTAGVFNRNNPSVGYETIPSFSYPAKLEQLTGIELTNLGVGGVTTEGWYDLYKNEDLSGFDFAIIQLGVNDHAQGQSVWPVADKDAMRSIITKLLSENNGITVFVSTIIPATSFGGRSYISQGIRDLIEEINNPMVILLDMEEYGHTGESSAYNCGHLSAYGYTRLAMDYKAYISYVISTNKTLFRQVQFVGTNMSY